MKKKIIAYNRVEKPVLEKLQQSYDARFFQNADTKHDPAFLTALREAEGIIGLDLPVDADLLAHAHKLKVISNVSVGYDNLDLDAMSRHGVMGTNTPGVLDDTVADAIFGILIAAARRIPELDQFVKNGKWQSAAIDNDHFGHNVHHKTLGIIGMGRIGKAIAKRGYFGFDMPILYHTRSPKPDAEEAFAAEYCSLETLLQESDFVCLMAPLTPETEGLIGKREFQLMKSSAIFINGSRGPTVIEQDLVDALKNNDITAAGLDVFSQEPVEPDHPLLNMTQVVTTPHIGSSTHETEEKMSELAAKNLESGLNGEKPVNLINPEAWKF
ncbi:D-glycerate dehydrogenase [Barrientosiimonas marina]|uniref:2-hydroxyacid dehydrogenase n=1 Tax=Lentibacillus kimchii TaxID=1542911 RepID=A0ABW2UV57_9BACI